MCGGIGGGEEGWVRGVMASCIPYVLQLGRLGWCRLGWLGVPWSAVAVVLRTSMIGVMDPCSSSEVGRHTMATFPTLNKSIFSHLLKTSPQLEHIT